MILFQNSKIKIACQHKIVLVLIIEISYRIIIETKELEMFERDGHFWVFPISNKANGEWIYAYNGSSAKALWFIKHMVNPSSYIKASKKV